MLISWTLKGASLSPWPTSCTTAQNHHGPCPTRVHGGGVRREGRHQEQDASVGYRGGCHGSWLQPIWHKYVITQNNLLNQPSMWNWGCISRRGTSPWPPCEWCSRAPWGWMGVSHQCDFVTAWIKTSLLRCSRPTLVNFWRTSQRPT